MKWSEVALGEVAELKYGKSLPASVRLPGETPVYGSNGRVGSHSLPLTAGQTIIVGRKGSLGEVHFSPNPCWPIDTTYYIDQCSTTVDLRWLSYRLAGLGLKELNRAAAIPGLNREDAYRQNFLLPPLDEQRRIAAMLDHADDLKAKQLKVLTHLEEAKSSYFFALTRKADWSSAPIGSLGVIKTGKTPPTALEGMFGGDVPFLTPGDLGSDRRPARTVTDEGAMQSQVVRAGATLVCCIGATIGKVGVAKQRATFNQQINAVEWGPQVLDEYGHQALRGMRAQIVSRGASTTMPILSKSKFSSLEVPVPPLAVQQSFSLVASAIEERKSVRRRALKQSHELFASLQARAFRGEL